MGKISIKWENITHWEKYHSNGKISLVHSNGKNITQTGKIALKYQVQQEMFHLTFQLERSFAKVEKEFLQR